MTKVKLTVTESKCRCDYHKKGDEFVIEDLCPPICHELWNTAYPYIFTLLSGGYIENDEKTLPSFDIRCPDGGRVTIHGETVTTHHDL